MLCVHDFSQHVENAYILDPRQFFRLSYDRYLGGKYLVVVVILPIPGRTFLNCLAAGGEGIKPVLMLTEKLFFCTTD